MIGFGVGVFVMMGFNIYNQYMMHKYFKEQNAHWKAEIEKKLKSYK
jgi:hypothetical protein